MNNTIVSNRTKYTYSMSGMGRDMMYALYSTFLLVFLRRVLILSNWELVAVGVVILVARIWDAINDPIMGSIIDNTKSRHGKFKPWILTGALISSVFFFLLFQDLGLRGIPFVVVFAILYVLAGMSFTMNDIAYWSMYPSFTSDQKQRESIGSLARIFASIGMFLAIALVPILYQNFPGGEGQGFFVISLVVCLIFVISQVVVFFFVREEKSVLTNVTQEKTRLKDIVKIIFKNDQLVVIIVSIFLFNTGYFITTSLGMVFFDYDFNKYGGIEFTLFSGILAVSQLTALIVFPSLVKKIGRRKLFTYAVVAIAIGYLLFMSVGYFRIPKNMITIGIAGLILFSGQGFIQVLVLVMLADTIEYGQWKNHTRNESVIFAINPFVTKLATSIQALVYTLTLSFSGINEKVDNVVTKAQNDYYAEFGRIMPTEDVRALIATLTDERMLLQLRISMIAIPLLLIVASYLIYRAKYKIDTNFYNQITSELLERIEQKK